MSFSPAYVVCMTGVSLRESLHLSETTCSDFYKYFCPCNVSAAEFGRLGLFRSWSRRIAENLMKLASKDIQLRSACAGPVNVSLKQGGQLYVGKAEMLQ